MGASETEMTFESPTSFEKFLTRVGAAGVRNGNNILVAEFKDLKDGGVYTHEFPSTSISRTATSMENAIMRKV